MRSNKCQIVGVWCVNITGCIVRLHYDYISIQTIRPPHRPCLSIYVHTPCTEKNSDMPSLVVREKNTASLFSQRMHRTPRDSGRVGSDVTSAMIVVVSSAL